MLYKLYAMPLCRHAKSCQFNECIFSFLSSSAAAAKMGFKNSENAAVILSGSHNIGNQSAAGVPCAKGVVSGSKHVYMLCS